MVHIKYTVRMYSLLSSNQATLFEKSAKNKLTKFIIMQQEQKTLPTKATETTTIHESKHFPFQIVEITTSKENKEDKTFKIGACGQFVSEKTFKEYDKAEKYISSRPWELITNLMCITIKNAFEYEKSKS